MPERLRILIVDDDPGTADTLGDILEAKGYDVETTSSSLQALTLVQAKPRDVIFLDVKMPQLNGVEVLRWVRVMSPATLVVMMTAYALPELVAEAERLGALAILAKPLPLDRIMEFLEELAPARPVLIVQEDTTLASRVQDSLQSHGYPATWVAGTAQILEAVRQSRPDVILLDSTLLRSDVGGVLQAIRKIDATSTILVIAADGADPIHMLDRSLRDGVRVCFHTRFSPVEVLQRVTGIRIERATCKLRG